MRINYTKQQQFQFFIN